MRKTCQFFFNSIATIMSPTSPCSVAIGLLRAQSSNTSARCCPLHLSIFLPFPGRVRPQLLPRRARVRDRQRGRGVFHRSAYAPVRPPGVFAAAAAAAAAGGPRRRGVRGALRYHGRDPVGLEAGGGALQQRVRSGELSFLLFLCLFYICFFPFFFSMRALLTLCLKQKSVQARDEHG